MYSFKSLRDTKYSSLVVLVESQYLILKHVECFQTKLDSKQQNVVTIYSVFLRVFQVY